MIFTMYMCALTNNFSLSHASYKKLDEPLERVLVHGVHVGHARQAEEQNLSPVGNRHVVETSLVDLLRSPLNIFDFNLKQIRSINMFQIENFINLFYEIKIRLTIISALFILIASRVKMRGKSSTGEPSLLERPYRMSDCMSASCTAICARVTISCPRSSSKSGRSCATTIDRSCSARPL